MWVDDNLVDDGYMKRSLKCDLQRFFMTMIKMTMRGGVHLSLEFNFNLFHKIAVNVIQKANKPTKKSKKTLNTRLSTSCKEGLRCISNVWPCSTYIKNE